MFDRTAVNDNDPSEDRWVDALLGKALRHRREELALSVAALANRASTSAPSLERYERGELRIPSLVLVRLADALEAPLSHFLKAI